MNTSNLKVKQHLIEMNKTGKLMARLPSTYWQAGNEEQLKSAMKKLDEIELKDIEIEDVQFVPDRNVVIYTVCIHDFIRYALVVDKDFNVEYHQLQWRGIE